MLFFYTLHDVHSSVTTEYIKTLLEVGVAIMNLHAVCINHHKCVFTRSQACTDQYYVQCIVVNVHSTSGSQWCGGQWNVTGNGSNISKPFLRLMTEF